MLGLDKGKIGRLLLELEENGYLRSQYKFCREAHEPILLGTGGFSSVYEMYDEKNPSLHYAAKVIGFGSKTMDAELVSRTTQLQYFLGGQSENIVRILDLWSMKLRLNEEGALWEVLYPDSDQWEQEGLLIHIILMEKLERILLKDRYGNAVLAKDCLQNEEEVIRFATQIGQAVLTAHSHNILHRDIKLENIFWDESLGKYKLGDFGIAKLAEEGNAETIVFTDGYGAPEIERRLTDSYYVTADIYSFGITLYLLLNQLKFPGSDGYYADLVQYSPEFVFPAPANASETMAKTIRKMCSYRAEDRYQSVWEVLQALGMPSEAGSECGDAQALEDLETETYRKPEELKVQEESTSYESEHRQLTRQERKQRDKDYESDYNGLSICILVSSAVLFALLFKSLSPDAAYVSSWKFWILPVAVLVESVLKRAKEFHIGFAALTLGTAFYSIAALGMDVPQAALIFVVLCCSPSITAGCAVGAGLWTVQMLTGRWPWLDIFSRWDMGWLILILLAVVIRGDLYIQLIYAHGHPGEVCQQMLTGAQRGSGESIPCPIDKISQRRFLVGTQLMDKLGNLLILVGILLIILDYFHVMAVPEIIKRLHFVRVGIGMIVIEIIDMCFEIVLETGEDTADESMDK